MGLNYQVNATPYLYWTGTSRVQPKGVTQYDLLPLKVYSACSSLSNGTRWSRCCELALFSSSILSLFISEISAVLHFGLVVWYAQDLKTGICRRALTAAIYINVITR